MFFSRVQLDPARVRREGVPDLGDAYEGHRFVWRFFGDHEDRKRDFLYRIDSSPVGPRIYVVSERPPAQGDGPWRVETKKYDVELPAGTPLAFFLRANPTRRDHSQDPKDNRRHDVVMVEKRRRRAAGESVDTPTLVQDAATTWLQARSTDGGFSVHAEEVRAEGYRQWRFRRAEGRKDMQVSSVDFTGVLRVTDPSAFQRTLYHGIGPSKGFGFGLLLVKRL